MRGIDIYHGDSVNEGSVLKAIPEKAYMESDFVIVKATQGVSYKHTGFFYKMIERTLKDSKLAGAYHYAAGNDPVKEADYFISIVKKYVGKIILCLDWEENENKAFGSKTWCGKFIDRIKEKTGVTCVLYTGLDGCKQNEKLAGKIPLWFAGYPKPMKTDWDIPKFKYNLDKWRKADIWQYTSTNEKCDRNTTSLVKGDWQNMATPQSKSSSKNSTQNSTVEKSAQNSAVLKTAEILLIQARSWLGCKESDGSHKKIIDLYNSFKPLPRGYKVKYTDSWCATFVSACAIACNYIDIIPVECSCVQLIELAKQKGIWIENENRTPAPGEFILYDWQDDCKGDNKGTPDHVGIVEKISNSVITVIEGNYNDCVKRRQIKVNAKFIRGYIAPKYDKKTIKTETHYNKEETHVKITEKTPSEPIKKGYSGTFPALPPRGYYKKGDGMTTLKNYPTQLKRVQKLLIWLVNANLEVDGKFGEKTEAAVNAARTLFKLSKNGRFDETLLKKCKAYKK